MFAFGSFLYAYVHCDYVQEYSGVSLLTVGSSLFLELKKETKTQS